MIKGWTFKRYIGQSPEGSPFSNKVYVHQTSPDAVEKELVVSQTGRTNKRMGMAYVYLPANLIGKRVRIIIVPMGDV